MPVGYSVRILNKNLTADTSSIGVRLGRLCINLDVPVRTVATRLQVSNQSVYNWFVGAKTPHVDTAERIEAYMLELAQ
jgi:predicted transcriptional regulator